MFDEFNMNIYTVLIINNNNNNNNNNVNIYHNNLGREGG